MTGELEDSYAVLEVDRSAPAAEIRQAYLDLVKVWHPDRFLEDSPRLRRKAEEKLKAINQAYERLRSGAPAFESRSAAGERPAPPAVNPDLQPAHFGGIWGYVNSGRKLVIAPRFQHAFPFYEGLARVSERGRFGFIDATGEYAVYPEFHNARDFSGGLAGVVLSSLWGFIDRGGAFRVNPLFEDCRGFCETLAAVRWRGRWGYIDAEGRFAIHPRYEDAADFRHGWAEVRIGRKWVRINPAGEVYCQGEAARLEA